MKIHFIIENKQKIANHLGLPTRLADYIVNKYGDRAGYEIARYFKFEMLEGLSDGYNSFQHDDYRDIKWTDPETNKKRKIKRINRLSGDEAKGGSLIHPLTQMFYYYFNLPKKKREKLYQVSGRIENLFMHFQKSNFSKLKYIENNFLEFRNAKDLEDFNRLLFAERFPLIYKFKNGWGIYLKAQGYCSEEANEMGHCGRARSTDGLILSLRDKKLKPYITFDVRDGVIEQCYGRGDSIPGRQYLPYIKEFIDAKGLRVDPEIWLYGVLRGNDSIIQKQQLIKDIQEEGTFNIYNDDEVYKSETIQLSKKQIHTFIKKVEIITGEENIERIEITSKTYTSLMQRDWFSDASIILRKKGYLEVDPYDYSSEDYLKQIPVNSFSKFRSFYKFIDFDTKVLTGYYDYGALTFNLNIDLKMANYAELRFNLDNFKFYPKKGFDKTLRSLKVELQRLKKLAIDFIYSVINNLENIDSDSNDYDDYEGYFDRHYLGKK